MELNKLNEVYVANLLSTSFTKTMSPKAGFSGEKCFLRYVATYSHGRRDQSRSLSYSRLR